MITGEKRAIERRAARYGAGCKNQRREFLSKIMNAIHCDRRRARLCISNPCRVRCTRLRQTMLPLSPRKKRARKNKAPGPAGDERRVRRHHRADAEKRRQNCHQHHRAKCGRFIETISRETEDENRRHAPAQHRAEPHSSRVVPSSAVRRNQPRDHRRMIEIAERGDAARNSSNTLPPAAVAPSRDM